MHKSMSLAALAALLSSVAPSSSGAQGPALTANTIFFTVDNYYDLDANGDYRLYHSAGFYEPGGPGTNPRVFLLPEVSVVREKIQFFSSGGRQVTPGDAPAASIKSINIPLRYSGSLPTEPQGIGIAVQTGGEPQPAYLPGPSRDAAGNPLMHPWLNSMPMLMQAVGEDCGAYTRLLSKQEANLARWRSYRAETTGLNELVVALLIDGDVVSQRFIPGSVALSGSLPVLAVKQPSEEVVQRVADGNFEVQVSYRFRDAQVGSIDASFEVESILDSYIQESQRVMTSSKSSGMQIFHIGSRRTKVKQSMEQSLSREVSSGTQARTMIVMNDADDAQVARFEATFFPTLSKEQTIAAHLAAADEAKNAGKVDLANAHLQYANALQQGVTLAEVDAVGAAAALNRGDYATFLAKGVRFQDSSTRISGDFFRVAHERISTSESKVWTDVSKRSVQRAITLMLKPEDARSSPARLGVCGFRGGPIVGSILLTCIEQGSPLARAGVLQGEIMWKLGGRPIGSVSDLEAMLAEFEPGDKVDVVFVDLNGRTLTRRVKLGKGVPR
ncbi:MAG TPA: hypothetical protein VFZ09_38885 [Archangium sp.]|uniref:hypothetical protein n=1 Tax=Archangium sp. TaxID=1872627 RepID=UPI002E34013D|nr:hypothetical protein [Archangium sp.]HEX5752244.1 hypothetical protein [Archangium sp.]